MAVKTPDDQLVTRKDLATFGIQLSERLRKDIVYDLSEVIGQFAERVDERFNHLEARVDRLEEQFERLQNTLDRFLKRLDDIEKDNAARDMQIARLERWIEQVAQKTGVRLEY
jgi:predicted nuclease with TOPRIM domain